MKELHLICNAHLDPVWQWDWNEGAASALATFYSAAELCEEYDYVFCHNEALLYEYILSFQFSLVGVFKPNTVFNFDFACIVIVIFSF